MVVDLPVVAGVVIAFLAGAVVIVIFPVVAKIYMAGPGPEVSTADMAEHHIELCGWIAEGLRDAAGAVVADHFGGDQQGKLIIQLHCLAAEGLQRQTGKGEDG